MARTLDILRSLRTAPPLPGVAMRVLQLVRNPEYSLTELVDAVRTDPSLTARVLRLCNSAMFSLPAPVVSVADATNLIGSRNLVKLVLVSCAANHFQSAKSSVYGTPVDLWRNTFALATACQWLAKTCTKVDSNTAFTVGVLHNVGKVVLSQMPPGESGTPDPTASHVQREVLLFGFDHAAAASVVADSWQLPPELGQAMRTHHATDGGGTTPLAAALELAETAVLRAGIGNPFPDAPLPITQRNLDCLGLGAEAVDLAIDHVIGEMARNEELLNLGGSTGR